MHKEAYEWVAWYATGDPLAVLDIGGRNINGSPRPLFPAADPYRVLDIAPGTGVDIVADAATWTPDRTYDVVVCCEVFEHAHVWRDICRTAYRALRTGGMFLATMAGPGRAPHSAVDGSPHLREWEHYGNVEPEDLRIALKGAGFADPTVDQSGADVRCHAVKGRRR